MLDVRIDHRVASNLASLPSIDRVLAMLDGCLLACLACAHGGVSTAKCLILDLALDLAQAAGLRDDRT